MRILRTILLALLFSLIFGFALGTLLRLRFEQPVWYLSGTSPSEWRSQTQVFGPSTAPMRTAS